MQASTPATILVVEESAAVRELIEHALRECGHAVLSTKDAFEAFEVARRIRVDLLVLGALGGGRAPTLVRDLRSIQAGLRIVTVGDSDEHLAPIDSSTELSTPFSLTELRETVASSLAGRGGHALMRVRRTGSSA